MEFCEIRPFVRYIGVTQYVKNKESFVRAEDCRLVYIRSGEGRIFVDDQQARSFARGTLLILQPDHRFLIAPETEDAEAVYVEFDYTHDYENERSALPLHADAGKPLKRSHEAVTFEDAELLNEPLFVNAAEDIEPVLQGMCLTYLHRTRHWQIRLNTEIARLLCLFCEEKDDLTDRVIAMVEKRYMEQLVNGDIAAELGYHPNYANAVFRRQTGMTIHQYLIHYRVNTAMHMIEGTDLPISVIAEKTGFRYFSHFSQCFRRVTGRSPGDYRLKRV